MQLPAYADLTWPGGPTEHENGTIVLFVMRSMSATTAVLQRAVASWAALFAIGLGWPLLCSISMNGSAPCARRYSIRSSLSAWSEIAIMIGVISWRSPALTCAPRSTSAVKRVDSRASAAVSIAAR